MKSILSSINRNLLEQISWSKVVLAFDFDGTLAPIVRDPPSAVMRQQTKHLLGAVAKLYPVIIISGRAKRDIQKRVRGLGIVEVVGNHGIESWDTASRYPSMVQRWRPRLEACVELLKGVTIEDKGYSLAIHYRRSRAKKQARAAIAMAADELGDIRVIGGKQVLNLLPIDAPHKGIALERARERLGCDTAIYVGDDETDEDVFTLDQPGRLLTIRVGASRASAAAYCIPDQRSIDRLLKALLELRRKPIRRLVAV